MGRVRQSPLHVAIENAYVSRRGGPGGLGSDKAPNAVDGPALVKLLVERGADANQQMFFRAPREPGQVSASSRGTTPLHRACASADMELVKFLLAHGGDVNLATAHGETCMMLLVGSRNGEDTIIAALHVLHEAGANPNAVARVMWINRNRGGTALHLATRRSAKKVMAELVKLGADPNIRDEDGLTALDYAQSRGWLAALETRPPPRADLVKTLRELGATVELTKVPDLAGRVPAHRSAARARVGDLAAVSHTRPPVPRRRRAAFGRGCARRACGARACGSRVDPRQRDRTRCHAAHRAQAATWSP